MVKTDVKAIEEELEAGKHEFAELNGPSLPGSPSRALRQVQELRFGDFAQLCPEDIVNPSDELKSNPHFQVLRQAIYFMKNTMDQMNRLGRAIPNDSIERLLNFFTRPSAKSAFLFENDLRTACESGHQHIAGFNLWIARKKDIHDLKEIPAPIRRGKIMRALRIAVTAQASRFMARESGESSASVLMEPMLQEVRRTGRRAVAMVLVDTWPEGSQLHPCWRVAREELIARGFEDSGYSHIQAYTHPDGKETTLLFKWFVYPPQSELGKEVEKEYKSHFEHLTKRMRERLAALGPYIPPSNSRVLCIGAEGDGHDIADLYRQIVVVEVVREKHRRAKPGEERLTNLKVFNADPSEFHLAKNCFDTIFLSSVSPNALCSSRIEFAKYYSRVVACQSRQLKTGGHLILRCSAAPAKPIQGILRLSRTDGIEEGIPRKYQKASTAAQFRRFLSACGIEDVSEVEINDPNCASFLVSSALIPHFMCFMEDEDSCCLKPGHKDPANFLRQEDFEKIFRSRGFRILSSSSEQGTNSSMAFFDEQGNQIQLPAAHYRMITQKVSAEKSVELVQETARVIDDSEYLKVLRYQSKDGNVREIVKHLRDRFDLVLWFEDKQGNIQVMERVSYPRPITITGSPPFNQESLGGFMGDVSGRLSLSEAKETSIENACRAFLEDQGIHAEEFGELRPEDFYFSAPRDYDDVLRSLPVRIEPPSGSQEKSGRNHWSKKELRPVDARQLLRACHSGGMTNARFEREVYRLLISQGKSLGPWTGNSGNPLELEAQESSNFREENIPDLCTPPQHIAFQLLSKGPLKRYEIVRGTFVERSAKGEEIRRFERDYARRQESSKVSTNAGTVLPAVRIKKPDGTDEVYVGVDLQDSPVAQEQMGSSRIGTAITTDFPEDVTSFKAAEARLRTVLQDRYGLESKAFTRLGEEYFCSSSIAARRMSPYAVEVTAESAAASDLKFVPIRELLANIKDLKDGNLITLIYRAAHALGYLA